MKKRIAFSIALLMILCLALAGCAQRDNHAGATSNEPASESHDSGIGNPDNSESGGLDSDVEPIGDDESNSSTEGFYTYTVQGAELICEHNIDDYVFERDGVLIFDYASLAEDIGWRFSGYKASQIFLDKKKIYMFADEYSFDVKQVMFEGPVGEIYSSIYYVYSEEGDAASSTISFTRVDLTSTSGSGGPTYYLNTNYSSGTLNRDMAIIACYLLENITPESSEDPLSDIYGGPGSYNF